MAAIRFILLLLLAGTVSFAVGQHPDRELDSFEELVREAMVAGRTDRAVRTQVRQYIDAYGTVAPESFWSDTEEAIVGRCMDYLTILYAPTYREHFDKKGMRKLIRYYRSDYFQELLDISEQNNAVALQHTAEWGSFLQLKVAEETNRYTRLKINGTP